MAASKLKAPPLGSSAWIQHETDQNAQFVEQEGEEFSYVVRNELEWLNEHMADIMSKGIFDIKEALKTPGRLRGKTPRTIRKRDVNGSRQPLTDVFGPSIQLMQPRTSPQRTSPASKPVNFAIAEDSDVVSVPAKHTTSRARSPLRLGKPGYIDSGYHGMTEDENEEDIEMEAEIATQCSSQRTDSQTAYSEGQATSITRPSNVSVDNGPAATEESFLSAKEDQSTRAESGQGLSTGEEVVAMITNETVNGIAEPISGSTRSSLLAPEEDDVPDEEGQVVESSRSPSGLSPAQPLQRKSSFAFASLPARETFALKRSLGVRDSSQVIPQASQEPATQQRSIAASQDRDIDHEGEEAARPAAKTSTQLLQERITLLGKTKDVKQQKELMGGKPSNQAIYPTLPSVMTIEPSMVVQSTQNLEDDSRVGPVRQSPSKFVEHDMSDVDSPTRPPMHQKSISVMQLSSPKRPDLVPSSGHQKAVSVTNLGYSVLPSSHQSTTPAGSPIAKRFDGTLSASKNRFWSAVKSAKSIFASSASASVAAKLEVHDASPVLTRTMERENSADAKFSSILKMPGALLSSDDINTATSSKSSTKSRASVESDRKREKEMKAQQKAADALEKVREKERKVAAKQQADRVKQEQIDAAKREKQNASRNEHAPGCNAGDGAGPRQTEVFNPQKSTLAEGKPRAPGRLLKPSKAEHSTKVAPVSIRVASQSSRAGQPSTQSSLSKSQHEVSGLQGSTRMQARPASAQNAARGTAAPSNARVKALEAAARKRDADERAAQKKIELKRELDRKRAAKAEEERRAEEERKAAEQQRMQEAKQAAQRKAEQQAAEIKRKEQQRLELVRQQEEAQRAKAAQEAAEAMRRQQQTLQARSEMGGTLRQLTKTVPAESLGRSFAQMMNSVNPIKRALENDDADGHNAPQRPGLARGPPSFQQNSQNDAKRRRTNEEHDETNERHSVMAPPKRPSYMRKESTLSKFPHGYSHAPPPAAHHAASLFKSAVQSQHQQQQQQHVPRMAPMHPSQTVQVSNARIPFAENVNPPAHAMGPGSHTHGTYDANKYKTPARPAHATKSVKSSPLYTNPDNIQLPEIQTDSEDEDSEDEQANAGFRVPSWVASPALRDLLTQQQLVDPESVFGPIGELKMEEVFKNGKQDRLKRFRERGSSAAWVESGDAVTSAEKRRDIEARQRVAREGGWSFRPAY